METIISIIITVLFDDFQEENYFQQIQYLHHKEDLHLHHLEMKITLIIQALLIGTNILLTVHHIRNTEIHLNGFD